ncbi:MAG: hypothetical protein OXU20_06220 [Myxococcales bacterium]|nr:hypothetical protein [Myxococcales bacterium]
MVKKKRGYAARPIVWEAVDDLGQVEDRVVAERLGVTITSVHRARKKLGIPAANPTPRVDWKGVADLGAVPDNVIAKKLGVHPKTVARARGRMGIPAVGQTSLPSRRRRRRQIDWRSVRALGKAPDPEVARSLGVRPDVVWRARKKLGIPSFGSKVVDWDEVADTLGTLPDREIAEQLGVGRATVADRRRALGIGSWLSKRSA